MWIQSLSVLKSPCWACHSRECLFVVQNQQRRAALSYSTVAGTTPVLPVEQRAALQHCQCTRHTLPQHSGRKVRLHCPLWCQLCEYVIGVSGESRNFWGKGQWSPMGRGWDGFWGEGQWAPSHQLGVWRSAVSFASGVQSGAPETRVVFCNVSEHFEWNVSAVPEPEQCQYFDSLLSDCSH